MSENPVNSRIGDEMSPGGPVINWDRIIHKNVRTADDQGMGKVIAVPDNEDTIVISSQSADDIYRVPRSAVSGFNGAEVQLGITSESLVNYHVERGGAYEAQPSDVITQAQASHKVHAGREDTIVPVVEERLNVSKKRRTEEAMIAKRPEKRRESRQVPVTKERLVVERRKASSTTTAEKPVESETEIKIPLESEKLEVTKEPYVKEEVVVKKKPVTETRQVTDTVQSERVNVGDTTRRKSSKRQQ